MWWDVSWHLREMSVQVQYGRKQERAGSAFSLYRCSDTWKQRGKQWKVGRKRPKLQSSSEKVLARLMRHLRAKTSKEPHTGQEGFSSSYIPWVQPLEGKRAQPHPEHCAESQRAASEDCLPTTWDALEYNRAEVPNPWARHCYGSMTH